MVPLSIAETNLLNKGLKFVPTPKYINKDHLTLLTHYDQYADSIRCLTNGPKNTTINSQNLLRDYDETLTSLIHRNMKFIKGQRQYQIPFTNNISVEGYTECTKVKIAHSLIELFTTIWQHNLNLCQRRAITELQKLKVKIVIKPADKKLAIVILDRNTYIEQCLEHLSLLSNRERNPRHIEINATKCHHRLQERNTNFLSNTLLLSNSSSEAPPTMLLRFIQDTQTIRYSTHTSFKTYSPHSNSLLSSAQFIEHILQPLARSYPDYLQN